MSGDCSSNATITPHVSASKPYFARVYPISAIRDRTTRGMSTYVVVVISPATTTRPVVMSVSHATRASGSLVSTASSTESEIWSATLSGWPSVTDSDVKRKLRAAIAGATLADPVHRRSRNKHCRGRNKRCLSRNKRCRAGQPLLLLRLQEDDGGRRPAVGGAVDDQALQR